MIIICVHFNTRFVLKMDIFEVICVFMLTGLSLDFLSAIEAGCDPFWQKKYDFIKCLNIVYPNPGWVLSKQNANCFDL